MRIAGGKVQRVLHRKVHRVGGLGRHAPFLPVHGLAELREAAAVVEELRPLRVAERVVLADLQARVVDPLLGIPDADIERPELRAGLLLRRRRHPLELVDPAAERGDDVLDHLLGLGLVLGREVLLDVEPAHRVAEGDARRGDAPLPAVSLLLRASERRAVEAEPLLGKSGGQQRRGAVDRVVGQIVLPHLERLFAGERRDSGDRARMPDHGHRLARQTGRLEVGRPVEPRSLRRKLAQGPGIVRLVHVDRVRAAAVRLGDAALELVDARAARLGVADARELQDGDDVRLVLRLELDRIRVGIEVVVPIRHAESALQQVWHVPGPVLETGSGPHAERAVRLEVGAVEGVDVGAQACAEHSGQRSAIPDRRDRVELPLHGREPALFDRRLVHVGVVVRADHPGRRAGRGSGLPGALDQIHGPLLDFVLDDREGGVHGTVRGDGRGVHPAAVGVSVKVVPGPDFPVHGGDVDGGSLRPRLGAGPQADPEGQNQERHSRPPLDVFSHESPAFIRVSGAPAGPRSLHSQDRNREGAGFLAHSWRGLEGGRD